MRSTVQCVIYLNNIEKIDKRIGAISKETQGVQDQVKKLRDNNE